MLWQFLKDCFTGEDNVRANPAIKPNCALDSDPVFGWFLIISMSIAFGIVTLGIGFIPFFIWAVSLGKRPFKSVKET